MEGEECGEGHERPFKVLQALAKHKKMAFTVCLAVVGLNEASKTESAGNFKFQAETAACVNFGIEQGKEHSESNRKGINTSEFSVAIQLVRAQARKRLSSNHLDLTVFQSTQI